MKTLRFASSLTLLVCLAGPAAFAKSERSEVLIPAAVYEPFFRDKGELGQSVKSFFIDEVPVSNADFLRFARRHPQWRRSSVKAIFADPGYLKHWRGDLAIDPKTAAYPVVNVSWFAARKYCEDQGARLPTVAEWELAADDRNSKELEVILRWYSRAGDELSSARRFAKNRNGVRAMHGLIWEWVEDFSAVIMTSDSRDSNDGKQNQFCGAGALSARDPAAYATFMRFAFRSALKARYHGSLLGFRCARSVPEARLARSTR